MNDFNIIRIIVAGGRDFKDYEYLKTSIIEILSELESRYSTDQTKLEKNLIEFVSGVAKGADTLGERFAHEEGYIVKQFPADWSQFGNSAGFIRNIEMAKYASSKKDNSHGILIAFWDGESRGTKNMIYHAEKHGMEVHVFSY